MATTTPDGSRTAWEVDQEVLVTEHALDRYDDRTPADAPAPERAWELGEDIAHPELLIAAHAETPADRVRLYRRPQWGVAFLVVSPMVVTVWRPRDLNHGPTRAYLDAHGPHPEVEE